MIESLPILSILKILGSVLGLAFLGTAFYRVFNYKNMKDANKEKGRQLREAHDSIDKIGEIMREGEREQIEIDRLGPIGRDRVNKLLNEGDGD